MKNLLAGSCLLAMAGARWFLYCRGRPLDDLTALQQLEATATLFDGRTRRIERKPGRKWLLEVFFIDFDAFTECKSYAFNLCNVKGRSNCGPN